MNNNVKTILKKTFGGLNRAYYFRHFVFGLIFPIFLLSAPNEDMKNFASIAFFVVNTLLYPYSRFVYESIIGFIMGENIIISNIYIFLGWKALTMLICWMAAIFIAPLGLAYLFYYHHVKR